MYIANWLYFLSFIFFFFLVTKLKPSSSLFKFIYGKRLPLMLFLAFRPYWKLCQQPDLAFEVEWKKIMQKHNQGAYTKIQHNWPYNVISKCVNGSWPFICLMLINKIKKSTLWYCTWKVRLTLHVTLVSLKKLFSKFV